MTVHSDVHGRCPAAMCLLRRHSSNSGSKSDATPNVLTQRSSWFSVLSCEEFYTIFTAFLNTCSDLYHTACPHTVDGGS